MTKKINVTVWNEADNNQAAYPEGIHNAIAGFLSAAGLFSEVRTATLNQPEHGLTDEVLNNTDVLLWWGHSYHHCVSDEVVNRVHQRVLRGMGLILLHSAHASKIFHRLMGTDTVKLRWRDIGERERLWVIDHNHPITQGIPEYTDIPQSEMYGEHFEIPQPDELIFVSWYEGGEVFRGGCTFKRGSGKIFYFSPGHEAYPIYRMPVIQKIITNAVHWASPISYPDIVYDETPVSPEALAKGNK